MVDLDAAIKQLKLNNMLIQRSTYSFTIEQGQWKPDADSWSLVEMVNHLYTEERGDFRAHLARAWGMPILNPFEDNFPYNTLNLTAALESFNHERMQSIWWLEALDRADWSAECTLRDFSISAESMLHSWVAHDVLHLRQLIEIKYAHLLKDFGADSIRYAGEW